MKSGGRPGAAPVQNQWQSIRAAAGGSRQAACHVSLTTSQSEPPPELQLELDVSQR